MWSRPFFRVLTVWSALTNLVVNALFFVAVLRLIEGGFDALHIGLVEAVAGLAGIVGAVLAPWVIERARDRVADDRDRVELPAAGGPDGAVEPAARRRRRARPRHAAQPGRQRRDRRLPDRGHAARADRPGPVDHPVRLDVRDAARPRSWPACCLATLGGGPAILVLGVLTAGVALIPTLSRSVRAVPKPAQWDRYEAPVPVAA